MGNSFPALPGSVQHISVLEQRVDEGRNRRAFRQHDKGADEKKGDQHGYKPPSLVTPKKRKQFANDPETTRGGSRNAHHAHRDLPPLCRD
jgi:hypothetical protein